MAPIKLLLIEDSKNDIELLSYTLKKAGMDFLLTQVMTEDELLTALQSSPPDLVISDNSLPRLDGARALEIVRGQSSVVPFIVFSGASPEKFSEMKARGVTECLSKKDLNLMPELIRKSLLLS